jgi:hypothetical protein
VGTEPDNTAALATDRAVGADTPEPCVTPRLGGERPTLSRYFALRGITANKYCAVMRLAREISKEILGGTTRPYEGAKQIWEISLRLPEDHLPDLDSFVYAASEWEERPEDRHVFERGIVTAAKELLVDEEADRRPNS